MKIFLIGFMGCGKTTVGRALAKRLGLDLIDTDMVIVERCGRSISEMVSTEGEDSFRQRETELLEEIASYTTTSAVISCGGGMPCHADNISKMKQSGTTIYLKVSHSKLLQRLENNDNRFLIQNKSRDELRLYISETLHKREPIYLQADHTICNDKSPNECTDEIINLLS